MSFVIPNVDVAVTVQQAGEGTQLEEKIETLAVENRVLRDANVRLKSDMADLHRRFNTLATRYSEALEAINGG